jgi:(p)ppGpp synthase/HD superfamily hydrolase
MTDPVTTMLRQAYELAEKAHKGQKRKTSPDGEPPPDYITHPVRVAFMVAATEADSFHSLELVDCMIVALLHDVIEDTDHTVASLVDEGFKQWVDDVYVLSRRKPQECEHCAPQWDETHKVSRECEQAKGLESCQTNSDYIRAIREYAIEKASERNTRRLWWHETVIRVKRCDIAHNMETADILSSTMGERYEKCLRILLTKGA